MKTRSTPGKIYKPLEDARIEVLSSVSSESATMKSKRRKLQALFDELVTLEASAERLNTAQVAAGYRSLQVFLESVSSLQKACEHAEVSAESKAALTEKVEGWKHQRPHFFNDPPALLLAALPVSHPSAVDEQTSKKLRAEEIKATVQAMFPHLGRDTDGDDDIDEALRLVNLDKMPQPWVLNNPAVLLQPELLLAFLRSRGLNQSVLTGLYSTALMSSPLGRELEEIMREALISEGLLAADEEVLKEYRQHVLRLAKQLVREKVSFADFVVLYRDDLKAANKCAREIGILVARHTRGEGAARAFEGRMKLDRGALPAAWGDAIEAANKAAQNKSGGNPGREELSASQLRNRRRAAARQLRRQQPQPPPPASEQEQKRQRQPFTK